MQVSERRLVTNNIACETANPRLSPAIMPHEKVLFLVRHAKSSWKDPSLADRDRPLNRRGQRDAPCMGKRLAARAIRPELIVSSPAVRALTTAVAIAEELGYGRPDVVGEERIYGAGTLGLVEVIRHFDNTVDCVMLVGHNPALTELVNYLAECDIENVPTCGTAVLSFDVDKWTDVGKLRGNLLDFDYPKRSSQ